MIVKKDTRDKYKDIFLCMELRGAKKQTHLVEDGIWNHQKKRMQKAIKL